MVSVAGFILSLAEVYRSRIDLEDSRQCRADVLGINRRIPCPRQSDKPVPTVPSLSLRDGDILDAYLPERRTDGIEEIIASGFEVQVPNVKITSFTFM